MSLNLHMVGVIVDDMNRSVEFYRRLGVNIAEETVNSYHVPVEMGNMTFFLSSKKFNAKWDQGNSEASGGYRIVLEFYLESQEVVDKKYAELIAFGYESHLAPYVTPFNMYFAMVNDPDGNRILLSGEVEEKMK